MDEYNQTPPNGPPPSDQPPPQYQQQYQQPPPQQPPPYYDQQYYQQPPPYYQQQQYYGPAVPNEPVGFIQAYKAYWKNYANFNDRTSRAGYWWVFLMNALIGIVVSVVMAISTAGLLSYGLGDPYSYYDYGPSAESWSWLGGFIAFYIIYGIWGLANLVPSLAIIVRRLHDTGKNWVWMLLALIPFVGAIILIVLLAMPQKFPPENEFSYLRQV